MATRRKSPGFTAPREETAEIEEFLDENVREMFETISQTESEPEEKTVVAEEEPFIPMEITPTEDVGPRFVEEAIIPPPKAQSPLSAPQLQPKPKRHPRNIPKFSRYK